MTPSPKSAIDLFVDSSYERATQARIMRQIVLVEQMVPKTREHEIATRILLTLQDSLHVMIETRKVIQAAKTGEVKRDGSA